ncbi:MAG: flhA [Herminiimonas sp.]|nr:flhA [Herminiimonas sp.]
MLSALKKNLGDHSDAALVVLTIGILIVLFTPIPARLLDFLILANFSFALLILLLTFYTEKPVQFSTFPSLLLIATLFRLSLNIAATRLILSSADGGRVINTVGDYVVGGNYVIGLIVFFILIVVQYVVITNGAQRVAEVAARFTLDSMPGQQMSIDADLNMGFIDQAEAQRRRRNLEKEASFYGSMDGASKFVKGDAIAGIVILLINILGGWAIGVLQLGMKWDEALRVYTLLTVGDGIVTQVPALVIALGTGIIVTRSAADERLSAEVFRQLSLFPKILGMIMIALLVMMLLPGMPAFPIILLMTGFGLALVVTMRRREQPPLPDGPQAGDAQEGDLYAILPVDPVEVGIGRDLASLLNGADKLAADRIAAIRRQHAVDAGFVLPKVTLRDDRKLGAGMYEIRIYGNSVAAGELFPEKILAIHPGREARHLDGIETRDPTYGLPARWILEAQRADARAAGYTLVDPATVFITHLTEIFRQHAPALLSRSEVERIVNHLRKSEASLVEELVPAILSLGEVQKVLQNLLRETVSIRNLGLILEVLADAARHNKDVESLTEQVRQRLGSTICQGLIGKGGELFVLTLDPAIEQAIANSIRAIDERTTLVLEPKFAEQVIGRLAGQVEKMVNGNTRPVLLCAPELRRHIRRLTERVMPQLAVLSLTEIPPHINLRAFGVVTI